MGANGSTIAAVRAAEPAGSAVRVRRLPAELSGLLVRCVRRGLQRGMPRGELARQLYLIANQSVLLVVGGMMFFGAVMMAHAAAEARRIVGDVAVIGPAFFELMVRELGPSLSALLAAVRVSAALAAELASMKVTEQLDALRMSAGDPDADLVFPRIVAGLIGVPTLCILGTLAAALTAAFVGTHFYDTDGAAFLDPRYTDSGDLLAFLLKSSAYGLLIPLAACHSGLAARGGPAAVGEATTAGVVNASLLVLLADLVIGSTLYLVGLG